MTVVVAAMESENELIVLTRNELVKAFIKWKNDIDADGVDDVTNLTVDELAARQADYLIEVLNEGKGE